jgi:hypothetical protein
MEVRGQERLYYDAGCGPCTFFARAVTWASRRKVVAIPLDSALADRDLDPLPTSTRYGYAHLADHGGLRSGADIMGPLLGVTFGGAAARVAIPAGPVDRSLRWTYNLFWRARRRSACTAAPAARSG